jgi:hypothetical protein
LNYSALLRRRIRSVLTPSGKRSSAPATTVEGSGTEVMCGGGGCGGGQGGLHGGHGGWQTGIFGEQSTTRFAFKLDADAANNPATVRITVKFLMVCFFIVLPYGDAIIAQVFFSTMRWRDRLAHFWDIKNTVNSKVKLELEKFLQCTFFKSYPIKITFFQSSSSQKYAARRRF